MTLCSRLCHTGEQITMTTLDSTQMLLKFKSQGSPLGNKSSWALSYDTIPEPTWGLGGAAFLCRLCWRLKTWGGRTPPPSTVHLQCSSNKVYNLNVEVYIYYKQGLNHRLGGRFEDVLVNSEQLSWHKTHERFILQMKSCVCLFCVFSFRFGGWSQPLRFASE